MNIHIFDNEQQTAHAVTHQLEKCLNTVRRNHFYLAISGGTTSEHLFRLWAEMYDHDFPWHRIHLYWVDERCVAPSDGDSNYGLAKRLFLDKVRIPRMQIHRIMGEANPENEAHRYSELIRKNLPSTEGIPLFDLILLGIGNDGHTASIFPGQPELLSASAPYLPSVNPYNQQKRISITGEPIIRAKFTLLHAVGEEKADILSRIVRPLSATESLPAAYVCQNADHIEIFTDKKAAKKIKENGESAI